MAQWKAIGWQWAGVSLAALAVLTAAALIAVWVQKKFPGEGCDERQKQIRGDAYRFSFWVGILLCAGLYGWSYMGNEIPLETETLLVLGIYAQVLAFHLYCLTRGMELPLASRGRLTIAMYALVVFANVQSFFGNLEYAEAYELYSKVEPDTTLIPGVVGERTYLMMASAVVFAALALMHLIQWFRGREEE